MSLLQPCPRWLSVLVIWLVMFDMLTMEKMTYLVIWVQYMSNNFDRQIHFV